MYISSGIENKIERIAMLEKPRECAQGGTYAHTVPMCINRNKVVNVDFCVARLVAALEAGGFRPAASCCGHGKMPANVMLEDRTVVVMLTQEEAEDAMKRYRR